MTIVAERSTLANGLRVVTEHVTDLHSVTLGAWVAVGSRSEDPKAGEWGASHFLEHLLFKGTEQRGARDIAEAIESVGGEMNAFTSHEHTAYYVRVPVQHLQLGLEILMDVVFEPAFRADEVESERQVILEEIGMRDDVPDDLVHDLLGQAVFPGHALGREVIGSRSSIGAMSRDQIARYHRRHYTADNVVIAAAGGVEHDRVLELCSDVDVPVGDSIANGDGPPSDALEGRAIQRDLEQAHVIVGLRGLDQLDEDRYALGVLNQALGGGMSSRLFQEIREDRGLAYAVYSFRAAYRDAGIFAAYVGTSPEHAVQTYDLVNAQLDRIVADSTLPDEELRAARGHITGALAMSLETSASRMRRIGRAELIEGEVPTLEEVIARVERVDSDDVARVIDRVIRDQPRAVAVVGPESATRLAQ